MRIYTCEVTTQNGLPFRYEVTEYPDAKEEAARRAKLYHNHRYAKEPAYKASHVKVKSVRMIRIGVRSIDR